MFKPEGVFAVMLTPFTKAGDVSEQELRRLVDFLIGAGVDGLFPLGSAGESVHLSREEKVRAMGIIVDQARGRVPVTPGVGSTHPKESIFLANTAKEMGCAGVVVAPPYYYPLSQEMIEKYYEAIIEAVDLPIILYNIPLFSVPLDYDVVKRLSRRKNVVGMKESSGSMVDLVHFMDKVKQIGEDINFLTGREETLFPCLMMGAKGCMAATACVLPEVMVGIYRAWQKGDYDEARRLQFSIPLLVRAMFALPFPLGFKVALETRGFDMGPPIQPLSDAERFKYRTVKARIEKVIAPLLDSLKNQSQATGGAR
jgi:4-hydroxy-tetrahydrodipicolinate synthase